MLARMRTIKQCIAELKKDDPDTCITEYYIRKLVKSRKIMYRVSGRRTLINYDRLLDFLNGEEWEQPSNILPFSGMRKIEARG